MHSPLPESAVHNIACRPAVHDEFGQKVNELDRRLKRNGMDYHSWDTLTDHQQEIFTQNLFLDPLGANGVDEYVQTAVHSCGCADVDEELYHHSPALMAAIDEEKAKLPLMKIKIGESLNNLNEFIDSVLYENMNDPVENAIRLAEFKLPSNLTSQGYLRPQYVGAILRHAGLPDTSGEVQAIQKAFKTAQDAIPDPLTPQSLQDTFALILRSELHKMLSRESSVDRRGGKGKQSLSPGEILKVRNVFKGEAADMFDEVDIQNLKGTPARRLKLMAKMVRDGKYFTILVPSVDPFTGKETEMEIQAVLDKDFEDIESLPLYDDQEALLATLQNAGIPIPTFSETLDAFAHTVDSTRIGDDEAKALLKGEKPTQGVAAYMGVYYMPRRPFTLPVDVQATQGSIIKYYKDNFDRDVAPGDLFVTAEGEAGIYVPPLISLSDVVKKPEIGGGGAGTAAEVANMERFKNRLKEVKEANGIPLDDPVTIVIEYKDKNGQEKTYEIKDVVTMQQSEGHKQDPKSDLSLRDTKGNEIFHISHKDGKTASAAQQWGGISKKSGLSDAPAAVAFGTELKKYLTTLPNWNREDLGEKGSPAPGQPFGYLPPIDEEWARNALRSFMGPEFDVTEAGARSGTDQLVDAVIQSEMVPSYSNGKIKLDTDEGHIFLREAMKGMTNVEAYNYAFGEKPPAIGGPAYAPAFFTKNDQGRNDLGIRRARVTIMPAANRVPKTVLVKTKSGYQWQPANLGKNGNWPKFKK